MLTGFRVLGSVLGSVFESAFWGLLCPIPLAPDQAVAQVEVAPGGRGRA